MQARADSLLQVINNILDFSKIEAGKMELDAVSFDLRTCLETRLPRLARGRATRAWSLHSTSGPTFPNS